MKKALSFTTLSILILIAIVGIFSEPADDSPTWLSDLFFSRLAGVSAIFAVKYFDRWFDTLWRWAAALAATLTDSRQ